MRIKEKDLNNLVVVRGQYGSKIAEHSKGDVINLVNAVDSGLIEMGDTFGFSETRSFFDADGQEWSPALGNDV